MAKRQQQTDSVTRRKPLSVEEAWKLAQEQFERMTDAEKVQTLKDAGILTPTGRLAKPYRDPLPKKSKA